MSTQRELIERLGAIFVLIVAPTLLVIGCAPAMQGRALETTVITNLRAGVESLNHGRVDEAARAFRAAADTAERLGPDNALLALSFSFLFLAHSDERRTGDAEQAAQRAVAVLDRNPGSTHLATAMSTLLLGVIYLRTEPARAEPLLTRGLRIAEQAKGNDHPFTGAFAALLAAAHVGMGSPREAGPFIERALAIADSLDSRAPPGAPSFAHGLLGMTLTTAHRAYLERGSVEIEQISRRRALIERLVGDEAQAGEIFMKMIASLGPEEAAPAPRPPLVAAPPAPSPPALSLDEACADNWHCFYGAGAAAYRAYRHADADKYYRSALKIAESLTPPDWQVAVTLNDLGLNYHYQGLHGEAEDFLTRALEVWERVRGREHQGTATTLNNLGECYRKQGRYADAERFLRRALMLRERLLAPGHVEIAGTILNLGLLADNQRQDREADQLYAKALALFETGRFDGGIAEVAYNLGMLRHRQGIHYEAMALLRRSLRIRHALFSKIPAHPELARRCASLKQVLRETGGIAPEVTSLCGS